jgi:hypothetical protein
MRTDDNSLRMTMHTTALLLALSLTPQSADTTLAWRALHDPRFRWNSRQTEHLVVHAKVGTPLARSLVALGKPAERAVERDLRMLGERYSGQRMDVFFVGSREEMRPFSGGEAPGGWSTPRGTVFLVASDSAAAPLRHELMHSLSRRRWGASAELWVSEGLGVLASDCRGYDPDDIAKALDTVGKLRTFEEMRANFVVKGAVGVEYYMQAASMVSYIQRRFGLARLRQFWRDGGLSHAEQSLGLGVGALERDWRASLATRRASMPWSVFLSAVVAHGCE